MGTGSILVKKEQISDFFICQGYQQIRCGWKDRLRYPEGFPLISNQKGRDKSNARDHFF